jgi:hypothetical protein
VPDGTSRIVKNLLEICVVYTNLLFPHVEYSVSIERFGLKVKIFAHNCTKYVEQSQVHLNLIIIL